MSQDAVRRHSPSGSDSASDDGGRHGSMKSAGSGPGTSFSGGGALAVVPINPMPQRLRSWHGGGGGQHTSPPTSPTGRGSTGIKSPQSGDMNRDSSQVLSADSSQQMLGDQTGRDRHVRSFRNRPAGQRSPSHLRPHSTSGLDAGAQELSAETIGELREAFSLVDKDGSGAIDVHEVRILLDSLGVDMSDASDRDISALMQEVDQNKSGEIDFTEFVAFYRRLTRAAAARGVAMPNFKMRENAAASTAWKDPDAQEGTNAWPSTTPEQDEGDTTHPETETLQAAGSASDDPGSGERRSTPGGSKIKIGGILDMVRQGREEETKDEAYITDKQRAVRQRIYDMMYDLPSFAPDYVYRRLWDVLILVSILYCYILPTTENIMPLDPPDPPRLTLDVIFTIVLVLDILVNLNTAIQLEERSLTMVVEREQIWKIYSRSYKFPVDLVSALPIDLVIWGLTGRASWWRYCRLFRVVKLFKYSALFVMTDRGMMDPSFVRFYFVVKPMILMVFQICFAAHTLALGRVGTSPKVDSCEDIGFGRNSCTDDPTERYLYSLWWCWALLTTQGMANVENGTVYAYAAVVMLGSILLQGHIIAQWSAFFLKSNIEQQNRDNMRSTYAIMKQYGIPNSLQQEVLSFQYHSLRQNAASSFAHVLERLPGPMQREVGLYVKVDLVAKVPMFEQLSNDCKLELANCLEQTYCEPECFIIEHGEEGGEMFFMMHGFADVIVPLNDGSGEGMIVHTVKRGEFFGEIALLKREQKRSASVQALTYCDLFQLLFEDFDKLLNRFSELRIRVEAEARSRGLLDDPKGKTRPSVAETEATDRRHTRVLGMEDRFGAVDDRRRSAVSSKRSSIATGEPPTPPPQRPGNVRRASLHPTAVASGGVGAVPLHKNQGRLGANDPGGGSNGHSALPEVELGSVTATETFRKMREGLRHHKQEGAAWAPAGQSETHFCHSEGNSSRDPCSRPVTPKAEGRSGSLLLEKVDSQLNRAEARQQTMPLGVFTPGSNAVSMPAVMPSPDTTTAAQEPPSGRRGSDIPAERMQSKPAQLDPNWGKDFQSPSWEEDLAEVFQKSRQDRRSFRTKDMLPGSKDGKPAEKQRVPPSPVQTNTGSDDPDNQPRIRRSSSAPGAGTMLKMVNVLPSHTSHPTGSREGTQADASAHVTLSQTMTGVARGASGMTLSSPRNKSPVAGQQSVLHTVRTGLSATGLTSSHHEAGPYVGVIDDRMALAEARMLRRVHIAEERVRKDLWEQGSVLKNVEQKVLRMMHIMDCQESIRPTGRLERGGDFAGLLGKPVSLRH